MNVSSRIGSPGKRVVVVVVVVVVVIIVVVTGTGRPTCLLIPYSRR